jgi:hypothetical protein
VLRVLLDIAAEAILADLRKRLSRARLTVWLIEADLEAMRWQDWGN